jgi:hypothetical protein
LHLGLRGVHGNLASGYFDNLSGLGDLERNVEREGAADIEVNLFEFADCESGGINPYSVVSRRQIGHGEPTVTASGGFPARAGCGVDDYHFCASDHRALRIRHRAV